MLRLHIAVFLFGLAGLFGKSLDLPAAAIVGGRTALAAAALGVWYLLRRSEGRRLTPAWALALGLSGALLAVHWLTFFQAIQCSSVATGLLSFATYPVFVAILEPCFSRSRVRAPDLVFAALVVAGLAFVVPSYDWGDRFVRGAFFGLISAATFALLTLVNRRFVAGADAVAVALCQNVWAAAFLLPFGRPLLALSGAQLLQLIALGVVCTALAHTLFIASLKTVRPQVVSVAAGLEPVYGILMAFALLGECPRWREVAGGCLIIAVAAASAWRNGRSAGLAPS